MNAEIVWIGTIHDFLLPNFLEYIESTKGDHNNFKEYGYAANEKIPTSE